VYERFYGLRELPFDLTPNPKYLYLTAKHREALSNLQYGIAKRRGITLLIGEAGTGKTTLVQTVLASDAFRGAFCVYVNNPSLTRDEFVEFLARAFGLSSHACLSKTALLLELEPLLRDRCERGIVTALLIDEAQVMPIELLEEVRLLANIETATDKLLPVVLAGQPQLAEKLNDPALRQLKQRVALRCDLQPLDLSDTAAYIAGRVRIAGGDGSRLFTREAVELIHLCSRGIPRTIGVICDNALVTGFASDQRPVGWQIVRSVCEDFDLKLPGWQPPESARRPGAAPPAAAPGSVADADGRFALAGEPMFSLFTRRRRFSFF